MNQQEFNKAAQESILFARFMAEFEGISAAQITLWLNALRQSDNKPCELAK